MSLISGDDLIQQTKRNKEVHILNKSQGRASSHPVKQKDTAEKKEKIFLIIYVHFISAFSIHSINSFFINCVLGKTYFGSRRLKSTVRKI